MGKYKQWLHHQEVGARLRDEIAAHEAEREQVLKLAPAKATPLPDRSNPIIAALLGQTSALKAPESPAAQGSRNGSSTTTPAPATTATTTTAEVVAEGRTIKDGPGAAEAKVVTASKTVEANSQTTKAAAQSAQEEAAATKPTAMNKPKPAAAPAKTTVEKPAAASAATATPAPQPDTIDPLLEQLLAQAENAPADPLEALNLLASQGPNLTHGEAPLPIGPVPSAPLSPPASMASTGPSGPLTPPGSTVPPASSGPLNQPGGAAPMLPTAPLNSSNIPGEQPALKTLLSEAKPAAEPQKPTASASTSVAVGVETVATTEVSLRAESVTRVEKVRSDTDELVASRPTEGYTEPRLIVPQWLRSMELGQEGQESSTTSSTTEEADSKQRFSVSLPFENEEDMRLHESVERWWQRWRQQG
jgi:hypothetical protein